MQIADVETQNTAHYVSEIDACRSCKSKNIVNVWSFGKTPLANSYLKQEELDKQELFVPLEVCRCQSCNLVQLRHTVDPEILFRNYLYVSSTSPTFVAHFETYAKYLVETLGLSPASLVVDIGSNDGILLKPLMALGMRALGVEPAALIADMANKEGLKTIPEFFTPQVAKKIADENGLAQVITMNNAFAHTNTEKIIRGVRELLSPDGVFVFEVQYLKDLIEKNLFDMVYHEHLFYYHLTPLATFFAQQGMHMFDAQHVPVHGGSIRVFTRRAGDTNSITARLRDMLETETRAGLNSDDTYRDFAAKVDKNKRNLKELLLDIKKGGKRVVGYGAPAKATTLLHTFDIDKEVLDYIVDDDKKFKQGRYMPGSHIPIVPTERLYEDWPDYCLILAWNFADSIIKNHARFTARGNRFIIPIPTPKII